MSIDTAAPPRPTDPPSQRPTAATPVRPLVSALGALSVLAGSAAVLTVVSGRGWIVPAGQVVGLIWLIGVGCRLLRLPVTVTALLQGAGMVVTLTAVFTNGGYGGVIPNAAAVREAGALLAGAVEQIAGSTVPALSSPELAFLITGALGLMALMVDFFLTGADAPALVGLPLLCLYSVPAALADELLPWWAFAIPAGSYALLVAVAGHPGRRVGLRAGLGVTATGGAALLIAVSGSVLLADSISQVGTGGRFNSGTGAAPGGDIGLSPFARLHGDLQRREQRELLQVSGMPGPDYLRTTALEDWDPAQGFSLTDPGAGTRPAGSPVIVEPLVRNPDAQPVTVTVRVRNFTDRFVPMFPGTTAVAGLAGDYSYDPALGSVFRDDASRPRDYQLTVAYGFISPDLLRADSTTPTPGLVSAAGITGGTAELARSITGSGSTAFDKALLLMNYFTDPANGFVYSLQVPTGNSGDLLSDFLQNKQGYCEQYAAAMTVMARSVGIPARVAVGFTQGTQTGPGTYLITSHNAHAWVEVRFDGAGWVRFDPTPLSQDIAGQQGFQTQAADTAPQDIPPTTPAGTDSPVSADPATAFATRTEVQTVADSSDPTPAAPGFWEPAYGWAIATVAVLAAISTVPWACRRHRARRRMTVAAGGGPTAAAAAWAEVEDLAVDHGLHSSPGSTVRRASNQLARDGKLGVVARAALRRIALGTELAWYSEHGHAVEPGTDLVDDVRRIAVDLEHAAPRSLARRLLPRSLTHGAGLSTVSERKRSDDC